MKFRFIAAEKAQYPVTLLCRCLGVSRSGYYAWTTRPPSRRAETDARLTAQLRVVHADSRQTYGRPRLCQALRVRGIAVSGRRVARLMRAAGLRARGRRRFVVTTDSTHRWPMAPDRVRRRFRPRRLNRVWAADMTACRTQHGWCYLAVILDLASRRVVGWAVRETPTLDLVITALRQAVPRLRRPAPLIHHSDRGIQYASPRFRALLAQLGIHASMSRRANCWDNAVVESFFSSFKAEAVPDRPWPDRFTATTAIREYVDFYNDRRLHSTLGYQSPSAFEEHISPAV
jgi:transposase InsO family protein